MSRYFLFIELLDPEINALIHGLRSAFGYAERNDNIHVTVRGPYDSVIDQEHIDKISNTLGDEPLLIQSAGVFSNKNESTVYIKISNERLKKIWWKPDYPIKKYGFNPHISLYRGKNHYLAECAYNFLKEENINVLCRDYILTPYVQKQIDMFETPNEHIGEHFLALSHRNVVDKNVIKRAIIEMEHCKSINTSELS